jgi:hypothetical protein
LGQSLFYAKVLEGIIVLGKRSGDSSERAKQEGEQEKTPSVGEACALFDRIDGTDSRRRHRYHRTVQKIIQPPATL